MSRPGFVQGLFVGEVREHLLHPYPSIEDREQPRVFALLEQVRGLAADLAAAPRATAGERARMLAERGLTGLTVPAEHGGHGLSFRAAGRVLRDLGAVDAGLGVALWTHAAVVVPALVRFGTPEQRAAWLPGLARGDGGLAAFAVTEATGSDPGTLRTRARGVPGGVALTGTKPWVTNARGDAGLLLVLARTAEHDATRKPRLGAFLLRGDAPGVRVTPRALAGLPSLAVAEVGFEDALVPPAGALGDAGRGFPLMAGLLDAARPLLAATLVGQSKRLLQLAVERARERRSFGRTIGEYSIIQDRIARMVADTFAVESVTHLTLGWQDRGLADPALEGAICRLAAAEALGRTAADASQVLASAGVEPGHPVEQASRDARVLQVVDATNETLRSYLALGGIREPAASRHLLAEALADPLKGLGQLRSLATRQLRRRLGGREGLSVHPSLEAQGQAFDASAEHFAAVVARILREHPGELGDMQHVQSRLANAVIDLTVLAACLCRTSAGVDRRGETGSRRELDVTVMFSAAAERRIRANLAGLERNDDELRKGIAARAGADGGYPFDIL